MTLNGNVTHFQVTNNLVHDNNNIGIDIIGYENTGPVGYDEASYGVVSGNTIYNISGIGKPGRALPTTPTDSIVTGVHMSRSSGT